MCKYITNRTHNVHTYGRAKFLTYFPVFPDNSKKAIKIINHMADNELNKLFGQQYELKSSILPIFQRLTRKREQTKKKRGLPSRHRYLQADRSEFEGHSKLIFPHLLHQGYHSVKRQHAKSTLHHGTKPDSTEVTQICETSEHENNIYICSFIHSRMHINI